MKLNRFEIAFLCKQLFVASIITYTINSFYSIFGINFILIKIPENIITSLGWILLAGLIEIILLIITSYFLSKHKSEKKDDVLTDIKNKHFRYNFPRKNFNIYLICIIVPLVEEFLFRYIFFEILLYTLDNIYVACIIPSIIFAVLHKKIFLIPYHIAGAITLQLLYINFGFLSAVIAHGGFNFLTWYNNEYNNENSVK